MNVKSLGEKLSALLGLGHAPVAITFRATAPAGVARVERAGPAGCAYWKLAGEGQVFYTEAADHYNCPIGAYTHGVDLPAERAAELQQVVGTMVGLEYIRMEEVPAMPRRTEPFGVAVYAPLAVAPVDPDVVLVRGDARQIMLVAEAARAAGIGHDGATMGRPGLLDDPAGHEHGARQYEPRLHRQPRLHGARRRRAVLHHSRRPPARRGRQARDRRPRQPRAAAVPRGRVAPPSPERHLNPWMRPRRPARRRSDPEHRRALLHADPRRHGGAGRQGGASRPGRRRSGLGAALLGPGERDLHEREPQQAQPRRRHEGARRAARSSDGWSRRADVFVQSLRAGAVDELGLGWDDARRINPRLVYCSITAFGTEGPLQDRPGYDPLMQAYSGIMSVNGHRGQAPARVANVHHRHGHGHVGGARHPGGAARARRARAAARTSPPRCSRRRSRAVAIQMGSYLGRGRGAGAAGLGHADDRARTRPSRRATVGDDRRGVRRAVREDLRGARLPELSADARSRVEPRARRPIGRRWSRRSPP